MLCGTGTDWVDGGLGSEFIHGGLGNDVLLGEMGDDIIIGGAGDDIIDGEDGSDVIQGCDGNDTLTGGTGDDQMTGGLGADHFVFDSGSGSDTILSFESSDVILVVHGVNGTTVATEEDLLARMVDTANGADLDLGSGNGVLLLNVKASQIEAKNLLVQGAEVPVVPETGESNTPPVGLDQELTIPMNSAIGITLTATEADGDSVTYKLVEAPLHGSLSGTAPTLTYIPTDGYAGADRFTFQASDGQAQSNTATVKITVVDTTEPVIRLVGNAAMTIEAESAFADPGATALDNYDGDITTKIVATGTVNTSRTGTYTVTYNVSDAAGNAAEPAIRTVTVIADNDTTKPVITLLGSSYVTVKLGKTYTDAGATALDLRDGNLTSKIVTTGNVNTWWPRTYSVKYNVKDAAGNAADTVTRTVKVTFFRRATPKTNC